MSTLPTRAPQHTAATPTVSLPSTTDRRVGLIDRLTLRLGLWLLTRHAARVQVIELRTADAHRARVQTAQREQRERDWYRAATLLRPPS
ncbi:hypothetical protein [Microbacterium trichothecenolyticum]|uniref:Uncharacterized protein n=1 Tax=Microbacterium trichothecenolyticum TaxID=69370 RepID=A0ABU0TQI6_MICTR|nr:hypothetical protein [Microbacterium trichothecenolyticum]MDQ1121933.1 hypothetical protein [Microbacterium trichothecenolyticum]